MAKDDYGRLSGYGSHKDKRLKREQNLLFSLYESELDEADDDFEDFDSANED